LASVYTASVEFPQPNKIDRFVHNDGQKDGVTESIFTILKPIRLRTSGLDCDSKRYCFIVS